MRAKNKQNLQRLLVHVHLFYQGQIDYILKKLKNISNCDFDLFVTVVDNCRDVNSKILDFKPDAHIIKVDNIGYDVWPFIQVIKQVNLDNYDLILKLHTKNFRADSFFRKGFEFYGYDWRNSLFDTYLKSKKQFKKMLECFKNDEKLGLIDKDLWHSEVRLCCPEGAYMLWDELKRINFKSKYRYYNSGTMFLARACIFKFLQNTDYKKEQFSLSVQTGSAGTLAHVYERIFSIAVDEFGYKTKTIKDLSEKTKLRIKSLLSPKTNSLFLTDLYLLLQLKLHKKDTIMFWGASKYLKRVIYRYKISDNNILGIIDKNPELYSRKIGKFNIFPPDKLKELKPKYVISMIQNYNFINYKRIAKNIKSDYSESVLLPNIFKNKTDSVFSRKKMKLGVSYNLFDGEELLEASIKSIRKNVDYINVIYQKKSYYGQKATDNIEEFLKSLMDKGLIDEIYLYDKDFCEANKLIYEKEKRDIGLQLARRAKCTHFLNMDVDEFYDEEKLEIAKDYITENKIAVSAVPIYEYLKTPEYRFVNSYSVTGDNGEYSFYVPFIIKIDNKSSYKKSSDFPCLVDLSRRCNNGGKFYLFSVQDIVMHHMSTIRKNLIRKYENSNFTLGNNTLRASIETMKNDLMAWDFEENRLGNSEYALFQTKLIKKVENKFDIHIE